MAQTRSPQRRYTVLIGTSGRWGDIFSSLVMTYWKGIGQPETGARVGIVLWESRTEVSFSIKRKTIVLYVYVIQE